MKQYTETTYSTATEVSPFVEALVPFEKCYYHIRRQQHLESLADTTCSSALLNESTDNVRCKIEELFVPLLSHVLSSERQPGTDEVSPLYEIVPRIRNYLALSNYFIASSMEYLCSPRGEIARQKLQTLLGRSTEIMEYHASFFLEKLLRQQSESTTRDIIAAFTHPDYEFRNIIFDFERIPAAQAELTGCHFGLNHHVLFIGCGSLSISGLAYANTGAKVTLVDIDPFALESFSRVYAALPEEMQSRIHRQLAVADEYCYITKGNFSSIAMAGLVGNKDLILESFQRCLSCSQQKPTVLVRTPKPNLLKLFYYDASIRDFARKRYLVSDPGIEAPLVTHVLSLDTIDADERDAACRDSCFSDLFTINKNGIAYPNRMHQ